MNFNIGAAVNRRYQRGFIVVSVLSVSSCASVVKLLDSDKELHHRDTEFSQRHRS